MVGINSGKNTGSCWRTNWCTSIGGIKLDTFRCEAVNIIGIYPLMAVATDHVCRLSISNNQNNIWFIHLIPFLIQREEGGNNKFTATDFLANWKTQIHLGAYCY